MTPQGPHARSTASGVVRHYWKISGARPLHVILPAILILVSNLFEGASLALIIPLTDAVAQNSFDFLPDSAAFGWITSLIPTSLANSASRDAVILGLIVSLIVLARAGKLGVHYIARWYMVARTEAYRVTISRETFRRVLTFGQQYFDRQAIGKIDTEIGWSNSVLGLLAAAEGIFRHLIAIVVKGAIMFAISVPLFFAFMIAVPFVQWVVAGVNRSVRRIAQEGADVERRMRAQVLDVLGSVPLVKAYSQEDAATDEYGRVLREAERVAVRRDRMISMRYPVEEIMILLVLMAAQGTTMAVRGGFQPTDIAVLGAFLVVLQQTLIDYKSVSRFGLTVIEEIPRLEAVAGLFTDEGKFSVPSGHRSFDGVEEEITVTGLSFEYHGGHKVLRDIDATIPAGQITAIVGASGAGKTTFVDLIARFYDCPPNTIRIDGVDIREFSLPSLHARMAIVSQDVWLLNRTLRQNLLFGLDSPRGDDALLQALHDVELGSFIDSLPLRLDTEVGGRGVRLSGGQRQRVALARALLRDPEILILDEATSALDSRVEKRVAEAIARRVVGHTLIVIAHRLSTIRNADQILVMDKGRIIERGTWDDLSKAGGTFASLLEAQHDEGAVLPA